MGVSIKLTEEEMKYINLFQSLTGATVYDCVIDRDFDRLIFLVKKGQVGIVVGKNGINIRRYKKIFGKDVEIVEYAETPEEIIRNSVYPARVEKIVFREEPGGRKVATVYVPFSDKAVAIGRNGKNIHRARLLAKRYFGIDWVAVK